MRKICFLLLLAAWGARAEDIVLTSGIIYQNVQIIIETEQVVTYATGSGSTFTIAKTAIKEIIRTPFDPAGKSRTSSIEARVKHYYKRPNIQFLPIAFTTFLLSCEYFNKADYADSWIDIAKALDMSPRRFEYIRAESYVLGAILLGTSIYQTIYALKKVEVTVDGQMIGLNIHF